jgi:hypothetical protein
MALVWNQAELSKHAQDALTRAVDTARHRGDRIIGSEDLVRKKKGLVFVDVTCLFAEAAVGL